MKKLLIPIAIIGILIFVLGSWYVKTNNTLVDMKGQATKQWANVESSYQRRSDLIGNLVKTVQGAADLVTKTAGGNGVAAEICEWLLRARDAWPYS